MEDEVKKVVEVAVKLLSAKSLRNGNDFNRGCTTYVAGHRGVKADEEKTDTDTVGPVVRCGGA